MFKKIASTILILAVLALPACALFENETAQNAAIVAVNVPIVVADIEKATKALTKLHQEKNIFSDEELSSLNEALDLYRIVKLQYDVLKNLGEIPSPEESEMLWNNVREVYIKAITIVNNHAEQYDKITLYNIELLDLHAKSLDVNVRKLLKDPTAQNINKILTLVGTMISVGIKVAATL